MARGGWQQGPIEIGGGRATVRMPSLPRPPGSAIRLILVAVAALLLLFTGYYQIEPEEVGVVQRFGAYVRTTGPGPHLKIPFGVETVTKVPVQRTLKTARELGLTGQVRFIQGDLFGQDLRQASVVTLFLTPGVNLRLRPKLLKELRPGTRIVSHSFNMGNWVPLKTVQVEGSPVYLWVIPDEKRQPH